MRTMGVTRRYLQVWLEMISSPVGLLQGLVPKVWAALGEVSGESQWSPQEHIPTNPGPRKWRGALWERGVVGEGYCGRGALWERALWVKPTGAMALRGETRLGGHAGWRGITKHPALSLLPHSGSVSALLIGWSQPEARGQGNRWCGPQRPTSWWTEWRRKWPERVESGVGGADGGNPAWELPYHFLRALWAHSIHSNSCCVYATGEILRNSSVTPFYR